MVKLAMTSTLSSRLKFAALSALLMALAGCASPAKTLPCASTDWYEIGRQHGSRGVASIKEDPINKSCKAPDQKLDAKSLYESGVSLGLTEYCTETNGFQLGKSNIKYNGACPQILEESFLRGYKKGQKAVQLTNEKQTLRSKIQSLEINLEKAQSLALRGLLKAERITLMSEDVKIDGQIAALKKSLDVSIVE